MILYGDELFIDYNNNAKPIVLDYGPVFPKFEKNKHRKHYKWFSYSGKKNFDI